LLLRERTGEGSQVDVSMLESLAEWMGNPMYYTHGGQQPAPRTGAFHPSVVPYGPFTAGDGQTAMMGVQNEREWKRFCAVVLDDAAPADDPRFANNTVRTVNRAALDAQTAEGFARLTSEAVLDRLERAQIATARVNTTADLWEHPQLAARERWTQIGTPAGAV